MTHRLHLFRIHLRLNRLSARAPIRKDPLTVPVRMRLPDFLHLWMQRTTSLCRNQTSQGVVIGNPKKSISRAQANCSVGGKKNGCGCWLFAKGDRLSIVPKCGTRMLLVRIFPDIPGIDRRTYECPRCEHEVTESFQLERSATETA